MTDFLLSSALFGIAFVLALLVAQRVRSSYARAKRGGHLACPWCASPKPPTPEALVIRTQLEVRAVCQECGAFGPRVEIEHSTADPEAGIRNLVLGSQHAMARWDRRRGA